MSASASPLSTPPPSLTRRPFSILCARSCDGGRALTSVKARQVIVYGEFVPTVSCDLCDRHINMNASDTQLQGDCSPKGWNELFMAWCACDTIGQVAHSTSSCIPDVGVQNCQAGATDSLHDVLPTRRHARTQPTDWLIRPRYIGITVLSGTTKIKLNHKQATMCDSQTVPK